jgi:hypothetical protein
LHSLVYVRLDLARMHAVLLAQRASLLHRTQGSTPLWH